MLPRDQQKTTCRMPSALGFWPSFELVGNCVRVEIFAPRELQLHAMCWLQTMSRTLTFSSCSWDDVSNKWVWVLHMVVLREMLWALELDGGTTQAPSACYSLPAGNICSLLQLHQDLQCWYPVGLLAFRQRTSYPKKRSALKRVYEDLSTVGQCLVPAICRAVPPSLSSLAHSVRGWHCFSFCQLFGEVELC